MSRFAWVTLATNDSYALGGLVLANSLKRVSTAHQLVILVTPTISESMRHKLSGVFDLVQEVNVLDSQDTANLALLKRPELGITFTKLHCWRLTQFEKCVFLDADTLVLQNCDELFDREELSAAPDVGWPDCFNTGVFVYRPSLDTYGKILEFAVTKGSFDGGDQGLLNSYFSDWATSDISKHLPFAYNTASTATYSYLPAFKQFGANTKILHFIGVVKPWLQNFDSQSQRVQTPAGYQHLTGFLQDWWNIFCESVHPNLDTTMSASPGEGCSQSLIGFNEDANREQGIVGALAQLKLGAPRTPEQIAYEDLMRRQCWESGQIDFAGRDSFANIWARIEQTMGTNPTAMAEEAAPAPAATPAPAPATIVPVMQKTPEDPATQCIDPVKQGETTTFDPTTNTTTVTTRVADGYKQVSTTVNADGTKSVQTKYFSDPVEETEEEEMVETSSSEVSQSQKTVLNKGKLVAQQSITQQQSANQSVTQRRSSQTSVSSQQVQQVQQVQSSQMRRSSQQTEISESVVESESVESSNLMQHLQNQKLNTHALFDKTKNMSKVVAKTASDVVAAGGKATKVIEKFDGGRKEKITTVYPDGHQTYEEKLIYDTLEEEVSEVTEETSELGSLKKVSAQSSKQDARAVTSVSGNTVTQQVMQVASTASREVCESRETADVTETTTTETLADGAVRTKVIERFDGGYKEKYTTKYKNGRQTYEEKTFYDTIKQSVSESASAQTATGTVTHTIGQNVVQNNLALTDNLNQLTQNNQQVTKVSNTKDTKNTRIESTTTETLTNGAKRTKVVERFDGGWKEKFTTVYPDGRQAYEEKTFYDSVQQEVNETSTETTVSESVKKTNAQNLQKTTNLVQSQQTEVTEETLVQQATNKQLTNTNVKTVTDENTTTETLKDGGKRTKVIERFDGGYKEKYTTVYPDGRQTYEEKTFYDTVSEEVTEVTQTTTTDTTQQSSQPKGQKPKAVQPNTVVETTTANVNKNQNVTTTQKRTTTVVSTTTTTLEDGGEQTKVVEKFDGGYTEKYTTKYPDGRETYAEKTFFDTVQEEVTETTTETNENVTKLTSNDKITDTIQPKVAKPVDKPKSGKPLTEEVKPNVAKPDDSKPGDKPKGDKPTTEQLKNIKNTKVTDVTETTTQKTTTVVSTTTTTLQDGGEQTKVVEKFDGGYVEKYTTKYPDGRETYEEKTFFDTVQEEVTETTTETTEKVTKVTSDDKRTEAIEPKDTKPVKSKPQDKPKGELPTTEGTEPKVAKPDKSKPGPEDKPSTEEVQPKLAKPAESKPGDKPKEDEPNTTVTDVTNVTTQKTTTIVSTTTTTLQDGGEQTKVVEKFDGGYTEKYTTKYPDGRETYEEKTFFDTVQEEVTETTTETTEKVTKVTSDGKTTEAIEPKDTKPVKSKPQDKPKGESPATEGTEPKVAKPDESKPGPEEVQPKLAKPVESKPGDKPKGDEPNTTVTDVTNVTTQKTTTIVSTTTTTLQDGGEQTKVVEKFDGGYTEKYTTKYPDGRETYEEKTFFDTVEEEITETTTETTQKVTKTSQDKKIEEEAKPVDKPSTEELKPKSTQPDTKVEDKKPQELTTADKPQPEKPTKDEGKPQVTLPETPQPTSNAPITDIMEVKNTTTKRSTTIDSTTTEILEDGGELTKVVEKFDGGHTVKYTTKYPDGKETYEEKTFYDTVEEEITETTTETTQKTNKKTSEEKKIIEEPSKPKDLKPSVEGPKPAEVKPVDVKPVEPKPEESKPGETKPEESKPEEPKTTDLKPEQPKPEGIKPTASTPEKSKPAETKPEEQKPITETTITQTNVTTTETNETKKVTNTSKETVPSETKPIAEGVKPQPLEAKPSAGEPTNAPTKPAEDKPQDNQPQAQKPVSAKPKPQTVNQENSETTVEEITTTTTLSQNETTRNESTPKDKKPKDVQPVKAVADEPQQPAVQKPKDSLVPQGGPNEPKPVTEVTSVTDTSNVTKTNQNSKTVVQTSQTEVVEETTTQTVNEQVQKVKPAAPLKPANEKPQPNKTGVEITEVTDETTTEITADGGKRTTVIVRFDGGYTVKYTTVYPDGRQTYEEKTFYDTVEEEVKETTETVTTDTCQNTNTDVTNTENKKVTVVESTTTETLPDGGKRTKVVEKFEGGYTEKYTTIYPDGRRAYEEKTFYDTVQVTDVTNVKQSTEVVETTTTETLPDGATKTIEIEKFDGGYKQKITTVYTDGRRAYEEKTFFDTVSKKVTDTTTEKTTTEKTTNVNTQNQNLTNVDVKNQTQVCDVTNTKKNIKNTVVESTRTEKTSDNGVVTIVVERFDGGYIEKRTTVYPDGRQTYDEKTFFDTVQTEVSETTTETTTTTGKVTKNQDVKAVNAKNTTQQLTDEQKVTKSVKDTTEVNKVNTQNQTTNVDVKNQTNTKNIKKTVVESTRTEKTSDNGVVTIVVERFDGGYIEKRTTVYPDGRQTYDEKTFFDTVQTEVSETTTEMTTKTGKVTQNQDMKAVNVKNTTQKLTDDVTKKAKTDQKVLRSVTNTTEVSKIDSTNTVQTSDGGERTTVVVKFDGGWKEQYTTVYPDGRQTFEEKVFYDTVQEEDTETTVETTESGQKTQVKAKKIQQDAQATTTVVGGVVTQKVAQVTSAENKQMTNTKSVKGGTNVTSSVSEQSSTAVQNVSAKTTKGSTTSVTKQASQVSQSSTKVQSSIKSTKDAAVTAKVTDNSAKSVVKKDVKAVTGATNTTSITSKTTKIATKDVKDVSSKVSSGEIIPAGGKTTKVIEKFDGGYKEIYTTVFPDGRQTTEEKTFFDEVEQKESKTTTEKLVGGRVTKTKDITSTRKVSATVTDKKNASTGTTSKVTSVKGDKPKLDANTTMVIEKFENGYKEVYTTTKPDGTQAITVKTFYDEVEHERVEETKKRTTTDGVEKKTTTGETVVTETEKVKRKIMPKGVPVVEKTSPITDEKNEDRLGRKASLNTEGGTTTMVKEEFEGGYKEIFTTRFPDGRVKTETQTYYDSEEEEEIEEYEEFEEPDSGAAGEEDGKAKAAAVTTEDDGEDGPGKLVIPDYSTPAEEAAAIEVNKLAASKLAMFQAQNETVEPVKPKKVWKRPTASATDPTPFTPVPPPRKKDVKTPYMKR